MILLLTITTETAMNNIDKYFKNNGLKWVDDSYGKCHSIAQDRLGSLIGITGLLKPQSVVDIGCGDGRFLRKLPDVPVRIGVDYSEKMIASAIFFGGDIIYQVADLNSNEGLQLIETLGVVDMVTMMGVIHYLSNPLATLKSINKCLSIDGVVVISFRNRLFNINKKSKYSESSFTKLQHQRLSSESNLFDTSCKSDIRLLSGGGGNNVFSHLRDEICATESYQGTTDPEWNPEGFEYWRQFTPLEAVILQEKAGFHVAKLIPIKTSLTDRLMGADESQSPGMISESSSFITVAGIAPV
jgi:SAM-dependent methyltransferase